MSHNKTIILPGGAGLVGQNLVVRLKEKGYRHIIVLDKHQTNLAILRKNHPDVVTEYVDLASPGDWLTYFKNADIVVMLQAQIGGNHYQDFERNNIESTRLILDAIKKNKITKLVHVSSSVVKSSADDFYTQTKTIQEQMVLNSGIEAPILRPTLMFGWFDRKHLGWLARFMQKIPVFPIPGNGEYIRQPLYVGDFCRIIMSCIDNEIKSGVYNISGHQKINYIDIIRAIKLTVGSKTKIIKIPYPLFYSLIFLWNQFDKNPPFTTQQLAALSAKDEFEIIDWPSIFNVSSTSFMDAIEETFQHHIYSKVTLEF